jgi:probable HAF family extracellular repeat protein
MQQLSMITKTLLLAGFSSLSLWTAPAQAVSFSGLGWLPDTSYSIANAISADGSVVVGSGACIEYSGCYGTSTFQAFRWTQETGMVGIGLDFNKNSNALALSADGSVVVGTFDDGLFSFNAFRWTQETGMVSLGANTRNATGVSADGSVVVGSVEVDVSDPKEQREAFLWTQTNGIVPLGSCGNEACSSAATAVSADGSVVIGFNYNAGIVSQGFRWTQATGIEGFNAVPNAVSADGSVIVGTGQNGAFRWTQSSGIVWLEDHKNSDSAATGVSADGSIIIGKQIFSSGSESFLWSQETGMVSLKETLIGKGLDVSGWTLNEATGISADGFTIVGNGTNPSGQSEAWVANLSPEAVPEPLTILGAMTAIGFGICFKRKLA